MQEAGCRARWQAVAWLWLELNKDQLAARQAVFCQSETGRVSNQSLDDVHYEMRL